MTELTELADWIYKNGAISDLEGLPLSQQVGQIRLDRLQALIDKREREAEARGVLRLASRFRGKGNTRLSGTEMANKVMETEANKLLEQLGVPQSRDNPALSDKHSSKEDI